MVQGRVDAAYYDVVLQFFEDFGLADLTLLLGLLMDHVVLEGV